MDRQATRWRELEADIAAGEVSVARADERDWRGSRARWLEAERSGCRRRRRRRRETDWRKLGRLSPTLGGKNLGHDPFASAPRRSTLDRDPFMLSDTALVMQRNVRINLVSYPRSLANCARGSGSVYPIIQVPYDSYGVFFSIACKGKSFATRIIIFNYLRENTTLIKIDLFIIIKLLLIEMFDTMIFANENDVYGSRFVYYTVLYDVFLSIVM